MMENYFICHSSVCKPWAKFNKKFFLFLSFFTWLFFVAEVRSSISTSMKTQTSPGSYFFCVRLCNQNKNAKHFPMDLTRHCRHGTKVWAHTQFNSTWITNKTVIVSLLNWAWFTLPIVFFAKSTCSKFIAKLVVILVFECQLGCILKKYLFMEKFKIMKNQLGLLLSTGRFQHNLTRCQRSFFCLFFVRCWWPRWCRGVDSFAISSMEICCPFQENREWKLVCEKSE